MRRISVKAVFVTAGIGGILALAMSGVLAQDGAAQQAPAGPAPKMAQEVYKNIQVLKGVPADQLLPTMQFIAASLGTDCEFCHVEGAREKDEKKPKLMARQMMQMVFNINKTTFEGERQVTCYTCHRGSEKPVGIPIISDQMTAPRPERASQAEQDNPAGMPTAEQLLDKYVRALGGEDAIRKISSRAEKGTSTDASGRSSAVEILAKAPDKRLFVTHLPNGDSIAAYSGNTGWQGVAGRPPRDMFTSEVEAAKFQDELSFPMRLKQAFRELRVENPEKIGGRDTYVVVGRVPGQPPVKLYFDQESGLLARLLFYTDTAFGLNPTQLDYADYREADGVKVPFRWTVSRPTSRLTVQIEQLQQNVPLEDSKFAKPSAPAASAQNVPAR